VLSAQQQTAVIAQASTDKRPASSECFPIFPWFMG